MSTKNKNLFWGAILVAGLMLSCQKEISLVPDPTPKVGTQWIYSYTTYDFLGGIYQQSEVTYTAVKDTLLGGELWLKIVDSSNVIVSLFRKKTDGLYQYANNASNLLCKDTGLVVGENYSTYNNGAPEVFTVAVVGTTLSTGAGKLTVNYYEGVKNGRVMDKIWYNYKVWIAQHILYKINPFGFYYKVYSINLKEIIY